MHEPVWRTQAPQRVSHRNRVRITAQLIDTRNDRHLWSDTYDRELDDIFAIQDEIATAIVSALKGQLGIEAAADSIVVKAATDNLDAYDLYLKGRNLFIARQNLDQAINLFQRAIELDPNYARAWEGLAATQAVADSWIADDGINHMPLAAEAAQHALELDPELSMPWSTRAIRLRRSCWRRQEWVCHTHRSANGSRRSNTRTQIIAPAWRNSIAGMNNSRLITVMNIRISW